MYSVQDQHLGFIFICSSYCIVLAYIVFIIFKVKKKDGQIYMFRSGNKDWCVAHGIVQLEGTMWFRRRLEEKEMVHTVSIFMAKK
jgi:hypothetical protein